MKKISTDELQKSFEIKKNQELFLDVRTQAEFAEGHLQDAINIPYEEVLMHLDFLNQNKKVYIYCRSGRRAQVAAEELEKSGKINFEIYCVNNGGMQEWCEKGYTTIFD